MIKSKIIALALLFMGCVPALRADVIYLKNGMFMKVRGAKEKDGQVEYWVGGTKYSIAKEAVDRIEAGSGPIKSGGGGAAIQDLTRRGETRAPGPRKMKDGGAAPPEQG